MEFLNEYSLAFAVALPVGIIAGLNVILAITGESGTLLLPSLRGYPAIEIPRVEATPEIVAAQSVDAAVNHDEYRRAA